jgi:hypothetical protein
VIGRLAFRSLTAHPVRSAVLAAGFGVGVGVMAILLGVAAIVLEQAQSPLQVGGGDVLVRIGPQVPARLLLTGTLQSDALRPRVRVASPFEQTDVFLHHDGKTTRVFAHGGIPSLERALQDPEMSGIDAWQDSPDDRAWRNDTPDKVLRNADRFHPVPDVPQWASSWAEWLYFNGRAGDTRFYLTFMVGPHTADGRRAAGVRLQLDRHGRMENYGSAATISDDEALRAPDLTIGASAVRLEGMRYHVHLDLPGAAGGRVVGDLTLDASPGRLVPPFEIHGPHGWLTGYVVPVMAGPLGGELMVHGTGEGGRSQGEGASSEAQGATGPASISLSGGSGYHDHNWGFWQGVSWQWGQVQHDNVSFIYGRVFPPREAADPEHFPGFVGALGPDGPLGYATNVRIDETNDAGGRPQAIAIRARGTALDLTLRFDVTSAVTTHMEGALATGRDFLQLRGNYTVTGRAGGRTIDFSAPGAAETFRGASK